MAIRSVLLIVKDALPFLTSSDDASITATQTEMYYYLERWLGHEGEGSVIIEDEGQYTPLQNMLIADMVAYMMAQRQIMKVMAGDGVNGPITKQLKKAKADVVETEFMTVKASDGALLQLPTELFLQNKLTEICNKSRELNISNPMCYNPDDIQLTVPFLVGEDFPTENKDAYTQLLNGTPIG